MIAAALVVFFVLPRKYQSDARFLVRSARQELVIGPGASAAATPRGDVTEELLNTEVELLRSRDILASRWMGENEKSTLHDLAAKYGVSAERIRQLEANAIKKLRGVMVEAA